MQPATVDYPVRVGLDAPLTVARWRPLVHWLLAIPHIIFLYVLGIVFGVVVFLAWFAILFTGNIPRGMFGFMTAVLRYQWRVATYIMWMREPYPSFDVNTELSDPGSDPARFTIEYPARLSRGLIFIKWLLIIPNVFVLTFVLFGAYVVWVIGFFAVVITGRWPEGMRNFLIGAMRWSYRVNAYHALMTDRYPPFSLQ